MGVKGAALTNTIFMSPGAMAIILSPADFPDPFYWDICSQVNVEYVELFGSASTQRDPGRADFTIDHRKLDAALKLAGIDV